MITINPIYIDYVLTPLVGGGDDAKEIAIYSVYQTDIEDDVKLLAKNILLPEFIKQHKQFKEAIKNSLAYYLIYNEKIDFKSVLISSLLPIKTPKNPMLFFQWIWDVFFENETIDYIKNKIVVEDFDINAPYNLLTKIGGYKN